MSAVIIPMFLMIGVLMFSLIGTQRSQLRVNRSLFNLGKTLAGQIADIQTRLQKVESVAHAPQSLPIAEMERRITALEKRRPE
jgi:hypothetical protein